MAAGTAGPTRTARTTTEKKRRVMGTHHPACRGIAATGDPKFRPEAGAGHWPLIPDP